MNILTENPWKSNKIVDPILSLSNKSQQEASSSNLDRFFSNCNSQNFHGHIPSSKDIIKPNLNYEQALLTTFKKSHHK